MTVAYCRSDIQTISIPPAQGGCGKAHAKGDATVFRLDCEKCAGVVLGHNRPRVLKWKEGIGHQKNQLDNWDGWTSVISDIPGRPAPEEDVMKIPLEIDQMYARQALKAAQVLTPAHAAAEGAVEAAVEDELARRRREHVQHEADPVPPEAPEVAEVRLGKRFTQAYDPTEAGYPVPATISPDQFRRGPVTTGQASYSAGYEPPLPMSSLAPESRLVARALMQDGQLEVPVSAIRRPC